MTLTTPASASMGSRLQTWFSSYFLSLAQATTHHVMGQANVGRTVQRPGRFVGFWYSSEYAAGTAGQTHTISIYKGSVAAGNKIYETVFTQTGAAGNFAAYTSTPAVSEAMTQVVAGDDIIIEFVTSATTGAITNVCFALEFEPEI